MQIYFDQHTEARPSLLVLEKLKQFSSHLGRSPFHPEMEQLVHIGNSGLSSIHESIGMASEDHFTLHSSGKEALSHLLFCLYSDFIRESGKNHFLTPILETNAIISPLQAFEKLGCAIKRLPLNSYGQLTPEILEKAITPRTGLVSLSYANPLTGVIHPVYDLAKVCEEKKVRVHVDASSIIGKMFFRFQDLPLDYLTFDGICFHAPRCAGLVQKSSAQLVSSISDPEINSVPFLASLALALEEMNANFENFTMESARLKMLFENEIVQNIPDAEVVFNESERLSHVTTILFPNVDAESLLYLLSRKGVYASIGGGNLPKIADMLIHCGIEQKLAHSAISFCLTDEISEKEIYETLNIITEAVKTLRSYSVKL